MPIEVILEQHKNSLLEASKDSPFVVFLCGPKLGPDNQTASARLRKKLKEELELHSFDVVLGEDDGLENARLKIGINAQDNELEFIRTHCNAVIIIADSVGAFCELGLFSWHFVHENGVINIENKTDFLLLVDQKYKTDRSYLNEGPFAAVHGYGQALFVDFDGFDTSDVLKRLKNRRGVVIMDRRGRPRSPSHGT